MNWHDYFDYDPLTGHLIWKMRSNGVSRNFNTQFGGKAAGSIVIGRKGRPIGRFVRLLGKSYIVHRIIWQIVYGAIPSGMEIDHRNGNPLDNRISNLRLATRAQNCANTKRRTDNSSGFKNVYFKAEKNKWVARVQSNGVRRYIGAFETAQEAYDAFCKIVGDVHGEFARIK